jgi:hypothetical protein
MKKVLLASLLFLSSFPLTAQITYRVYATREGLVGGTCANGHIIQTRDHFCALPSRKALNANGAYTYTVRISNPSNGKVANNVPQWDVGPWNTKDDYWNAPREWNTGLTKGLPEAQAAYQNGFNGGKDGSGRTVLNPAGIDLADGTFWDDLGMINNGWVDVTYNWVSTSTGTAIDNAATGFAASANWTTGTSSTDKYGTNYRYRSTAAISDVATFTISLGTSKSYNVAAWWPQGANRSATASYSVSHAGGTATVQVNQQINGGRWNSLGTWSMNAGNNTAKLSCWTTTGYIVVADAVKWQ